MYALRRRGCTEFPTTVGGGGGGGGCASDGRKRLSNFVVFGI